MSHWAKSQDVARDVFLSGDSREESISLPFPDFIGRLHTLTHPSFPHNSKISNE
jgi:hypothetical protein